jgi:hypothetical protein
MSLLYKKDDEYVLILGKITPKNIEHLDDPTKRFVKVNILPKLSSSNWYLGKSLMTSRDIGRKIITSEHILQTEFTAIEETTDGYDEICKRIEEYSYKNGVTVYF